MKRMNFKNLIILLFSFLFFPTIAFAQTPIGAMTVAVCGNQNLKAGFNYGLSQDLTGTLCTAGGGGGGGAVTIAAGSVASGAYLGGAIVDLGAQADAAAGTDTATASLIALLKRNNQNLATINTTAGGAIAAGANTIGNVNGAPNVTPTDCSGTITAGGTAQNAFTAQTTLHGFTVANIDSTTGSGEPLWISFTTTAAASTAASYPLSAPTATSFTGLASYSSPPGFGMNTALSIIGATTGHKFSCTWW